MSNPIRSISQNNYLLSNGGGGHEYSGANGVYVDNENEVIGLDTSASNAIETVIENSGAWGGAGLPISAGPGIKVGLENGVLMISKEEPTLLWSGTFTGTVGSSNYITLNEATTNFEEIEITMGSPYYTKNKYDGNATSLQVFSPYVANAYTNTVVYAEMFVVSNSGTRIYSNGITRQSSNGWSTESNMSVGEVQLTKVVGIGRKST